MVDLHRWRIRADFRFKHRENRMMKSRRANHLAARRMPGFGLRRHEAALRALAGLASPSAVSKDRRRPRTSYRFTGYKLFASVATVSVCCLTAAVMTSQPVETATIQQSSLAAEQDQGFDTKSETPASGTSRSECSGHSRHTDFGGVLVRVTLDCESKPQDWLVVDKKESGARSSDHSPTPNTN
jgi:hypothetical protein